MVTADVADARSRSLIDVLDFHFACSEETLDTTFSSLAISWT